MGTTYVETRFVDKNVSNDATSGSSKTQKTRYIYQKGTNIFLMCRVCLTQSSSNMYSLDKKFEIDSETDKTILVVEALQKITYSKVPLNGVYPQYLCPMCMSLLKMCYKFIVQFQESQLKLKELYHVYEIENIEDDYVDDNDNDNKENDQNDRKATVEVIYNNKKFNLNELLVVEAAESEDNNYKGFLNNLGKEVSATFADKARKDKSTNKDEELVSISIKENDRIVPIKELQLDEDANLVNYIIDESTLQHGETLKLKELLESSYDTLTNNQYIEIDLENNDIIESLIIERDSGTDSKELDNGYLHVPTITKYDRRKKGNGNNSTHDVFDEEIKFPCEICSRIFSTIRLLKAHIRRTHFPNKKRYSCEICGYVNNTRSAYMNHKLKHAGKQFACDICKKPYYTKAVLKVHMETHVNSRQHLCSVCGKSFNYANALVYHMRLHTGEKNYKCDFCNTSFRMQSALRRHVRVHTGEKPYKCAYCDKSFCSKGEVSCHENIHTGFRPYHCKYCKKGFTKTHNLKLHLLSHNGPHQCEICAKSFIEMAILVMHYKIAHKNMLPGSDEETEMKDEDAQLDEKL